MEIIKKGRIQKGWAKKSVCTGNGNGGGGCGAKLLVSASDLFATRRQIEDRCAETFATFTCPLCGVDTNIRNVPHRISSDLPSKENHFRNKIKED